MSRSFRHGGMEAFSLGPTELRAVMYDLPYPQTGRTRQIDPCPLSGREVIVEQRAHVFGELAVGPPREVGDHEGAQPELSAQAQGVDEPRVKLAALRLTGGFNRRRHRWAQILFFQRGAKRIADHFRHGINVALIPHRPLWIGLFASLGSTENC